MTIGDYSGTLKNGQKCLSKTKVGLLGKHLEREKNFFRWGEWKGTRLNWKIFHLFSNSRSCISEKIFVSCEVFLIRIVSEKKPMESLENAMESVECIFVFSIFRIYFIFLIPCFWHSTEFHSECDGMLCFLRSGNRSTCS